MLTAPCINKGRLKNIFRRPFNESKKLTALQPSPFKMIDIRHFADISGAADRIIYFGRMPPLFEAGTNFAVGQGRYINLYFGFGILTAPYRIGLNTQIRRPRSGTDGFFQRIIGISVQNLHARFIIAACFLINLLHQTDLGGIVSACKRDRRHQ